MTNADRIRAMTDQELAKALMKANDGELYIRFCKETPECNELLESGEIPEEWCLGCMVDWLQRPVEESQLPVRFHLDKQESGLLEE